MGSSIKFNDIKKEQLQELLNTSHSYTEVLRKLNLFDGGNNVNRLKVIIKKYELNEVILNSNRQLFFKEISKKGTREKYSLEELFSKRTDGRNITCSVKKYIIKYNIIEYKCAECENEGIWNNKKLTLILDHIDGDNTNNLLLNLRFICPNCDSQSDTYKGKNVVWEKKKCLDCGVNIYRTSIYCRNCYQKYNKNDNRLLSEEQVKYILENINVPNTTLAKQFNVSGNTIKKIKKNNGYKNIDLSLDKSIISDNIVNKELS